MGLLGRVRLFGRTLSVVLLVSTFAAWAATSESPGAVTFERFRQYSITSHEGKLISSVSVRLQSDRASGHETPVRFSREWRVHTDRSLSADGYLVRLALGWNSGRNFAAARDVHGLTSGVPGGSPDFDWTRTRTSAVMVPHWAAAAIFALAPAAWAGRQVAGAMSARYWRRAGRCPNCGYDLRGNTGRCSECGAVTSGALGT